MSSETSKDNNTCNFKFEISLNILNHLGRNLYRNFITVLSEAVSNSWDADATNVWITIDRDSSTITIQDDGDGMSSEDFQKKFLKIGYSKRTDSNRCASSPHLSLQGRPLIGRKGIGKLALLSCAGEVSIASRKAGDLGYVGGKIINARLDEAIADDLSTHEYQLEEYDLVSLLNEAQYHSKGTIIRLENLHEGILGTVENLKKNAALAFKFAIYDENFRIFINGDELTIDCIEDLMSNTQYLWLINGKGDDVSERIETMPKSSTNDNEYIRTSNISTSIPSLKGFIGSVRIPRNLAIYGAGERVGVDLLANGRLRDSNINKYTPSSRVTESYLFGHIYYDQLDDDKDRFVSSREGVIANDPMFKDFLSVFKDEILAQILKEWDQFRRKDREDGDPDQSANLTKTERKAEELFNATTKGYTSENESPTKDFINAWMDELADNARFNIESYADCFVSENIIRRYLAHINYQLDPSELQQAQDYREGHEKKKTQGNVSIEVRASIDPIDSDLFLFDIGTLAYWVWDAHRDDPTFSQKVEAIKTDGKTYTPIRDALMHTSLLTPDAKDMLRATRANIKGKIIVALSADEDLGS